jgi:hypothetical protein
MYEWDGQVFLARAVDNGHVLTIDGNVAYKEACRRPSPRRGVLFGVNGACTSMSVFRRMIPVTAPPGAASLSLTSERTYIWVPRHHSIGPI